jgi:hypothetical protein
MRKGASVIGAVLSAILLLTASAVLAQSFGEGHFYIGGMLDIYNPRERFHLPSSYSYIYLQNGMGPGIIMGLNLTSYLSFPEISADIISYCSKYHGDDLHYGEFDFSGQYRMCNVMLGAKYKFGHWRIEPYLRGGVLFQDIRYKEKHSYRDPFINDSTVTNFYWGFAPYIGGGVNYYISPRFYLALETLYSSGTGSSKSPYDAYHTLRLGGNHINFTLGCLPF